MTQTSNSKRTRLVKTAIKLAYKNGFSNTSLADIAKDADVPLGNVYYYFKTREEIGEAIIQERHQELNSAIQRWEKAGAAKQRLCAFVQSTVTRKLELARGGCPIGTMCIEFNKLGSPLGTKASEIFDKLLAWLHSQFDEIVKKSESRGAAIHLLSALQGAAVLSNSLHDPRLIETEAEQLQRWILAL